MTDTAWLVIGAVVIVVGVAVVFGRRLIGVKVTTKAGTFEAEGSKAPPLQHTGVVIDGAKGKEGVTAFSDTAGGVIIRNAESEEGKVEGVHRQPGGPGDPNA